MVAEVTPTVTLGGQRPHGLRPLHLLAAVRVAGLVRVGGLDSEPCAHLGGGHPCLGDPETGVTLGMRHPSSVGSAACPRYRQKELTFFKAWRKRSEVQLGSVQTQCDLAVRTGSGSPTAVMIVFAFWCVRPKLDPSCELRRGGSRPLWTPRPSMPDLKLDSLGGDSHRTAGAYSRSVTIDN